MRPRVRVSREGFSLVEMLFVLAIVGALLALTVPALQGMMLRKQVQEGMELAKLAERGVQAAWSIGGKMPADNAEAGIPDPEKIVANMVSRVDVRDGAVTVTFGNNAGKALHGRKLTIRPAIVADTPMVPIAWLCNNIPAPKGMTALGENGTDVPPEWLPVDCRGTPAN